MKKNTMIDWVAYNTPALDKLEITPLEGTNLKFISGEFSVISFIKEWIAASIYLSWKYNLWNKAKYFFECDNKKDLSSVYKTAFNYYRDRQYKINLDNRGVIDNDIDETYFTNNDVALLNFG